MIIMEIFHSLIEPIGLTLGQLMIREKICKLVRRSSQIKGKGQSSMNLLDILEA